MSRSIPPALAPVFACLSPAGAQTRAGGEFRVNSYTTDEQFLPAASADRTGGFVVAWGSIPGQDGHEGGAFGQRYSPASAALGAEFQVNTYTTGSQTFIDLKEGLAFPASVAKDGRGNFVVAWTSGPEQDGSYTGIFAQRYDAGGARRGGELRVNTYTTDFQQQNQVAMAPDGRFVIVWASRSQDGADPDVTVAPDGGFVAVWQSEGQDGSGYGIFVVQSQGPRPVLHWDATADERITPDALGQEKRWTLHVGGSFTDVPLANPFYRFIETLLHVGITGGCAATQYCPAAAATRDQMSVFVLLAKEGAGYQPPACTPPVFDDVPATHPFCRFIEELARRGVVSGCGGGNYCPAQPVTREQMGAFIGVTFSLRLYGA